ncbi:MAG: RNA 2',3'-cyclic phosphodiesterase [Acetobacteraceae bacterium]|nr:RNA 2',3'-cyclic phosphodiesterase [Acetobacteraceae bacterium]MSP29103.1 RNA 2',3'-cyclic phosphodiesterase [Acetobacteraceae bacterium]
MRLFVALDLPWELKQRLAFLCGDIPGARFVPAKNFHLTLRFIGEVSAAQAEDIDHSLAAIRLPCFDLSLAGVGTFSKASRSSALWVGADRDTALTHLQGKIESALRRAGLDPERRRFTPHVTLAGLSNVPEVKIAAFVMDKNLFRAAPVRMTDFTLFSSILGRDGSVYTPEVEYALE